MKKIFLAAVTPVFLFGCQSSTTTEQASIPAGVHSAVVEEVLQTNQYTYLHVKEGKNEPWLAVSKMQAAVGETYYYRDGLPMTDFASKELNRTFKEILFLDNLSTSPKIPVNENASAESQSPNGASQNPAMEKSASPMGAIAHTVVAEEVLQTSKYTYIRAKENNEELWIAVSKMEASVGKTYYFTGGLPMTEFESKELKKTFKEVLFVDNISENSAANKNNTSSGGQLNTITSKGSAIDLEKKEVKVKHVKDDITIATLVENKKSYNGKTIKVKGQVTKFTPGIMKRNWIHIQDGTEFSGKFDLTVTTDQEVKVGDNITVEGVINLDKDFGFGYFYDVIMENAKISQ